MGMMRVSYSNGTFLTSDLIARTLLEYTASLGREDSADTVTVPTLTADGRVSTIELVIGPASQMSATYEESIFPEPEPTDEIRRMSARMHPPTPSASAPEKNDDPHIRNQPDMDFP